jgi:outer membrane protein assembly factor BamB
MVRLVTTVGAVGGAVAVLLPGGPVRPARPDIEVLACAVALVAVAVLTFLRRPVTRPVAGALSVAAAAWAVYLLVDDLASGLPGASSAVLAVSAIVTVAGVAADVVRPVRLSLAGPLVGVLVVASVAGGLFAPRLPVRASEATAVEPPALAREPGERRWTWRTSEVVRGVVAAGAGVAVAADGGEITALDGASGAVRWRYGRSGAHVRVLESTPDRARVVAAFTPGQGTGAALLVVLDAVTGEVIRESIVADSLTDQLVPTNTALLLFEESVIRAADLDTGADLWTWSAPDDCAAPDAPHAGAEVVLTTLDCADQAGVVALDERTGDQRWDRMTDTAAGARELSVTPDGELALTQDMLLRTEDGAEVTEVDRSASVELGTHPLLSGDPADEVGPEIVDPVTGERTELPRITCEDPRAEATTTSAYLRVCGPDADASLVWQDFGGDSEVTRTPIGWGAASSGSATLLGARARAVVLPAPGVIVVARAGDTGIVGYPG